MKKALTLIFALLMFNSSLSHALPLEKFKNCTAVNAKYPGGVANNASAQNKNKKGELVASTATFVVDKKIYNANKGLDRDKDGIICEK